MKTAVVTGASGGIGLAAARALAADDYRVCCLSRSAPPEASFLHIPTDVADPAAVKRAFLQLGETFSGLDLLVNNAGFGISGAIELTEPEDARQLFDVNFFGGFYCAKYALPLLRASHGRIINVSSAAAIFSIPYQAFYSASKAAINSFTLSLRNEVSRFGVSVCAVMPGDVQTGFTAARKKNDAGEALYGDTIASSISLMEKDEKEGMSPEYLGSFLARIAKKRKVRPLYTAGAKYRLFAGIDKCLPKALVNRLVGMLYIK